MKLTKSQTDELIEKLEEINHIAGGCLCGFFESCENCNPYSLQTG